MNKKVYIVVLNYKNLEDTLACLESLRKVTYNDYHIVVVDNDSQDGSYEYLVEHATDCQVIQSGENRGYAAGNNVGIRYALEHQADYVCILNNDVEVEPDFLTKLVQYMESAPDVGMAGRWCTNLPSGTPSNRQGFLSVLARGVLSHCCREK